MSNITKMLDRLGLDPNVFDATMGRTAVPNEPVPIPYAPEPPLDSVSASPAPMDELLLDEAEAEMGAPLPGARLLSAEEIEAAYSNVGESASTCDRELSDYEYMEMLEGRCDPSIDPRMYMTPAGRRLFGMIEAKEQAASAGQEGDTEATPPPFPEDL